MKYRLLEFALEEAQFSMPVGRVEYLHLGPMQFEDFAIAMGHANLVDYLQKVSLDDIRAQRFPRPVHEKCLSLLKQFWVVGGLPEAVASYVQSGDFAEVARVHHSIVVTYRDDFNKYSQGSFLAIPVMPKGVKTVACIYLCCQFIEGEGFNQFPRSIWIKTNSFLIPTQY